MTTEQTAAATLLDKGIKVRVTAPLLLKAFGRKQIALHIKQPCLGNLYRISREYLAMNVTNEELANIGEANAHELFIRHGRCLSKIAALAWLNGRMSGKLFAGPVARWLYWHLTPMQLLTLVNVLVFMSSTEAFTNTIRSAASMRMTKPNLSPKNQGS